MLSKFFVNAFTIDEVENYAMPPLFCGTFINILVILYFTNSKVKIKEKIMTLVFFAIFILSFYMSKLNLLWTLGNTPAFFIYRYAFCFTFMYIFIAHKSFENFKEGLCLWKIILVFLIYEVISVIVIIFNLGVANKFWVLFDMGLCLSLCVCLWTYRLNFKNFFFRNIMVVVFLIVVIELFINSAYSMKELQEQSSKRELEYFVFWTNLYENMYSKLKTEDNSIYRTENRFSINNNDGLIYGYNGVDYSGSTYSRSLTEFIVNFGYNRRHVMMSSDMGNTKTADMILGTKYIMNLSKKIGVKDYEEYELNDKMKTYKNPYALSLGYSASDKILEEIEAENMNTFEYQNKFAKSLTNFDEDIFIKHEGKITEKTENINKNGYEYQKIDNEKEAKVIYEFEAERNEECYFYLLRS